MTMTQTPENNLYLWWRERTPEERAEHRSRLDAVEITELLRGIREDCKLFLAEVEAANGKPNGSASGSGNGANGHAEPTNHEDLEEAWSQLSPEEGENLERHYKPADDSNEDSDND